MGWLARNKDGLRLGSIFCVKLDDQTAKLRLFMCLPEARGLGLGKRLLTYRMAFAKAQGFQRMTLWTYESHEAARPLYTRTGWACVSSKPVHSFGVSLTKQQWEITL
jgi:GNAT superfamily N-acetyltransferase